MAYVYVEPKPTGRTESDPIEHFVIEHLNGRKEGGPYQTQAAALAAARAAGHWPLVARVRVTNKADLDHWRPA